MTYYDLKGFNKELTSNEMSELSAHNGTKIPSTATSNCVLDVRFNEKQGGTAFDISGNNYNGTLTNYTIPEKTLGVSNLWVNKYGNPITQY
jgi:hypothetical protein